MRARHILMILRLAILVPVLIIVSDMLTSIVPLMESLKGLGIAAPETLISVSVVALGIFIVLNNRSIGWLISFAWFANMLYVVITDSPVFETAFPTIHTLLMKILGETVMLPTSRVLYYIPLLVVVSVVNDYIEELTKKEKTMSRWEIPEEDIMGIVHNSFLVMVMATVMAVLAFLWAVDYLVKRGVDFGELYYLAPPLLLLGLGVSLSVGIFGRRNNTKHNVLVIKAKIPLGQSYSWKVEGSENLAVTVLTRDGKMQEREIRIETEVKEPPERVIIYVKRTDGDQDSTREIRLKKVKESTDGDTRFLWYTNMLPIEF